MTEIMTASEALRAGLTRYFNGKPCPKGHLAERHVSSGSCVECQRLRPRRIRSATALANNRKRQQRWRENNREKIRNQHKRWREDNPEKHAASNERWRKNNPEKVRAQSKRNYDYARAAAIQANRVAKRVGVPGTITASIVRALYFTQEGECMRCRASLNNGCVLDHVIPFSHGGHNNPKNLQLLCPDCDKVKTASDNSKTARVKRMTRHQ